MAAGSSQPFRPAGTATLSASTTPASVPLAGGGDSVLVTNASGTVAFVRFDASPGISASTTDTPVLPNARVLLGVNPFIGYAAAVLSSGTGTVYFTRGDGSYL